MRWQRCATKKAKRLARLLDKTRQECRFSDVDVTCAVDKYGRSKPAVFYTEKSNLLWLRTITTGITAVRAQRRTRPIRPDPPAKQVVSKTIKSKHP